MKKDHLDLLAKINKHFSQQKDGTYKVIDVIGSELTTEVETELRELGKAKNDVLNQEEIMFIQTAILYEEILMNEREKVISYPFEKPNIVTFDRWFDCHFTKVRDKFKLKLRQHNILQNIKYEYGGYIPKTISAEVLMKVRKKTYREFFQIAYPRPAQ